MKLSGIPYATDVDNGGLGHLLDLYLPEGRSDRPVPLVIWSTGSGWMEDEGKEGAPPVASAINQIGWAVAGVSVRSSCQTLFPGQVHDVKAAIRWLRHHADEYGLDPGRFAIMGDSSGGWLALMAALTIDMPELEGERGISDATSEVHAAVDLYGPTDFSHLDEQATDSDRSVFDEELGLRGGRSDPNAPESLLIGSPVVSSPELAAAASPISYARVHVPPMLIIHGTSDPLIAWQQSEGMHQALASHSVDSTLVLVDGVGHEHPYLDHVDIASRSVVRSTRTSGNDLELMKTDGPTWPAIVAFLRRALDC